MIVGEGLGLGIGLLVIGEGLAFDVGLVVIAGKILVGLGAIDGSKDGVLDASMGTLVSVAIGTGVTRVIKVGPRVGSKGTCECAGRNKLDRMKLNALINTTNTSKTIQTFSWESALRCFISLILLYRLRFCGH